MGDHGRDLGRRAVLVGSALALAGCVPDGSPDAGPTRRGPASSPSSSPSRPGLPRGGRAVFPGTRMFGYCGSPASPALGRLGTGPLRHEVSSMLGRVPDWRGSEQVLPVMELIATIARSSPGTDGLYRGRIAGDEIDDWLRVARAHRALLLINIQPGRADFLEEAKHYTPWLREPDVGLALDPEWSVGAHDVPGTVFGHITGRQLDEVAAWLSGLVTEHDLPQKPLVYHVLRPSIVSGESALTDRDELAVVKSVDGIGTPTDKTAAYRKVMRGTPGFVRPGFKLFFDEDARTGPLMTPRQVLSLDPTPQYVLYE